VLACLIWLNTLKDYELSWLQNIKMSKFQKKTLGDPSIFPLRVNRINTLGIYYKASSMSHTSLSNGGAMVNAWQVCDPILVQDNVTHSFCCFGSCKWHDQKVHTRNVLHPQVTKTL
jgi:hypothetical protein